MLTNKTWAIASIYQSPKITDSNFTLLFPSGYNRKNWAVGDKWHYIKAYKAFKEMYPRISTGSPLDPWRVVRGDIDGTQKTYPFFLPSTCCRNSNAADRELEPLYSELELGDPQVHQQVGSSFSQLDPQPRPQGFSLKKWVGPIFWGKSPGDEVAWYSFKNFTRAKIRYRLSPCWWRTSEECDRLRYIFFPPEISAFTWQIYYQGLYGFKSRWSATNPWQTGRIVLSVKNVLIPWGLQIAKGPIRFAQSFN